MCVKKYKELCNTNLWCSEYKAVEMSALQAEVGRVEGCVFWAKPFSYTFSYLMKSFNKGGETSAGSKQRFPPPILVTNISGVWIQYYAAFTLGRHKGTGVYFKMMN